MTLGEQLIAKLRSVDLGEVATDGIEEYKAIMREMVPRGFSPVKGGDWVDFYNEKYAKRAGKFSDGPVNLDIGEKRYEKLFKRVSKSADSATFDYDSTYRDIAMQHQTGMYDRGAVKPRELIPQSKEELPERVLEAVKNSFLKRL